MKTISESENRAFPFLPQLLLSFLFLSSVLTIKDLRAGEEACETPIVWYMDRDLDGHGDPTTSLSSCEPPEGYVATGDDCNDDPMQRGMIFHPGAKEPANFDDFNCDGKVATGPQFPFPKAVQEQKEKFVVGHFLQEGQLQTQGNGERTLLKAFKLGPYDFTGAMPKLWIKLENVSHLKEFSFFMGNQRLKNFVQFNLNSRQGQKWITEGDWVGLSLSWNELDMTKISLAPNMTLEDLKKNITDFQIRLRDDQKGMVKLSVRGLSAVEESRTSYPNGVISITFDDNWHSEYTYARPKMAQYHLKGTTYVIVGFLDTPNYLTTSELHELHATDGWEVGFHAFDPIMHIETYTHFPYATVERDMLSGVQWLWENGFGDGIAHFAYPKGEYKQPGKTDVYSLASKYFTSARTINERNRETVPPADAHKLRVLYITAPESVDDVVKKMAAGVKAGEWIILVLHDLVEHPLENDQWEISKFNQLMDVIGTQYSHVPVKTVGEVLREVSSK